MNWLGRHLATAAKHESDGAESAKAKMDKGKPIVSHPDSMARSFSPLVAQLRTSYLLSSWVAGGKLLLDATHAHTTHAKKKVH